MKILPIIHCIDTEGPLSESISVTMDRVYGLHKIKLPVNKETFLQLRDGALDDVYGVPLSKSFNPQTLNYNRSISDLEEMIAEICSEGFRKRHQDDFGQGWIYSWFCVAHEGFLENPRKRIAGFHAIFDLYMNWKGPEDDIQFHYHPLAPSKNASHCASGWIIGRSNLFEIMTRRLIDRNWFPSVNRPGFHVTRPDSHWFLEQFLPFDFANQSSLGESDLSEIDRRWGDWSRAPKDWVPYHPAHDDWQTKGSCSRLIGRCLNIGTRHSLLTNDDIHLAFRQIQEGDSAILSFTNHDFRKMGNDITDVYERIRSIQSEYFPKIKIKYFPSRAAIRHVNGSKSRTVGLRAELDGSDLIVHADGSVFGTQPYLSIKTVNQNYYHDNFQYVVPKTKWKYRFDKETFELDDVEQISIAANSVDGITEICRYNRANSDWLSFILND